MLINELIENNNQIVKEINNAKSQKIKDLKDLKKSFLLDILKNEYFINYINKTKIYIGEQDLSLDGFINSEINIDYADKMMYKTCIPKADTGRDSHAESIYRRTLGHDGA